MNGLSAAYTFRFSAMKWCRAAHSASPVNEVSLTINAKTRELTEEERARIAAQYGCIVKPHVAVTRILPRTLEEILAPEPVVEMTAKERIKARTTAGIVARKRGQAMAVALRKADRAAGIEARPLSSQEVAAAARRRLLREMVERGVTRRGAADALGVSLATVDDYVRDLRAAGAAVVWAKGNRKRVVGLQPRDLKALAMFQVGARRDEICVALDVSRHTVDIISARLKAAGHSWTPAKARKVAQVQGATVAVQARRDKLMTLADGTRTRQQVADILGIKLGTVDSDSFALRQAGQEPRYSAEGQGGRSKVKVTAEVKQ